MKDHLMSKGALAPLEQLVKKWDRFNNEEDNDDCGRERWQVREDCIQDLVAALAALPGLGGPQEPTNEEDQTRVAPLKAGADGQDLPQSDSGEKSPL